MTDCVNDDALLKAINLNLLMHTRSEDSRLRFFALTCSETLWRAHGEKLIGILGHFCINGEYVSLITLFQDSLPKQRPL